MDNTRIVETPNGYKAYLRAWITYPKFIEMTKGFTDNVVVDPNQPDQDKQREMKPYNASLELEVQENLIRYLILKIEDKTGTLVGLAEDYLPLPPDDAMAIMDV